uniref:Uncharacterized protein n=1 Tax=Rhizophora mucronata TaxID=61149 RepID=A0A2P2NLL3_RHIMU
MVISSQKQVEKHSKKLFDFSFSNDSSQMPFK